MRGSFRTDRAFRPGRTAGAARDASPRLEPLAARGPGPPAALRRTPRRTDCASGAQRRVARKPPACPGGPPAGRGQWIWPCTVAVSSLSEKGLGRKTEFGTRSRVSVRLSSE